MFAGKSPIPCGDGVPAMQLVVLPAYNNRRIA
jgi:hypothetical protein